MLLRVKIRNFLSFYDEVTFDMFPNPKKQSFQNHIYKGLPIPVLKMAGIYGANGSGKSNFIHALDFIRSFVTDKTFLKQTSLKRRRFRLCEKNEDDISFEIMFYHKKIFNYSVSFNEHGVTRESLRIIDVENGGDVVIFDREKNSLVSKDAIEKEGMVYRLAVNLLKMNPYSSLLTLNNEYPIIQGNEIRLAYKWFSTSLLLVGVHSQMPELISLYQNNAKMLQYTNEVFSKIGIGISEVEVKTLPVEQWLRENNDREGEYGIKELLRGIDNSVSVTSLADNNTSILSIEDVDGRPVVRELLFKQKGMDGYEGVLEADAQSDGTCRLLLLLPALFEAVFNGKVIVVDEIENSIHPNLIKAILKLFADTSSKGQLIFTSHYTGLLDQQNIMRPDEIWFTEKHEGKSTMYSLNDFKEHNTMSIEKGYLDGRYGAVPVMEELV